MLASVTLTEHELQLAFIVAAQRLAQDITEGRQNAHGLDRDSFEYHCNGCLNPKRTPIGIQP